ncbi:MAG: transglycosylase SLT domain-containing protein [Methylococcaceae bacterium]|nr:transglycosylase SLT domain-containing protein [Methylococcaceae bacterium]
MNVLCQIIKKSFIVLSIVLGGCFWSLQGVAADLAVQRLDFLHTEHLLAANKTDEFLESLEKLQDYPLYPYLKSQWLMTHLDQSAQIMPFLLRFHDTRYADQVRMAWLGALAEQQRWQEVMTHFRETDGIENQCLFNQARYLTGQKANALLAAKQLWLLGGDLPTRCDFLIGAFKASELFSKAMIWARFDAALQKNRVTLAQNLKGMMDLEAQGVANFWLQLHNKPELLQSDKFVRIPVEYQGRLFTHALQRMARKTPLPAMALWDARPANLNIDAQRQQVFERSLALALANNKLPEAYARLMQVSPADEEIQEWRVRAALIQRNWSHVANALALLSGDEQAKPKWQYWQARAKNELGDKAAAMAIFKQLAVKSDYYGFLSADYAELDYTFTDNPVMIEPALKAAVLARDDLKIVQELKYHQREHEAQKQWWYVIKRLDKEQIKAAAKIAEDWRWQQMAIFTLAKAEVWDDMGLRFPIFYEQSVLDNAAEQAVDPALIFGLIRQESAFDQEASSPVGARGLMQIMPATGVQIARELQERWGAEGSLFDPEVNIKYGAFYYSKLVRQFDGHFALAAAAYNAGPHRVKAWLPSIIGVSADVWVETIPFKETRKYVAAVLSYAIIYQQRLQRTGLKMRDLMRDVLPIEKLS